MYFTCSIIIVPISLEAIDRGKDMENMDGQHTFNWAREMWFLLRSCNTMDYLVLVFMPLYFSAFLFDWCAPSKYRRRYICLWVCQSPINADKYFAVTNSAYLPLMSKLAQCLAEVFHSSRAKLSRGAPELFILWLLAAPKLPNLSLFREVRRKSGLWRELTHG